MSYELFQTAADQYGEIKEQITALENLLKPIKEQLAKSGYETIVGSQYTITIQTRTQTELSEEKIMAEFNMTLSAYKKLTDSCKVEKDHITAVTYKPTKK